MNILLVRHAKAADKDSMPDEHRPLTGKGRRDALELGKALRHAGVKLDVVFTSPLVRAVETAELLAVGLGYEEALAVAPELEPGHPPEVVIEEVLLASAHHGAIALVGHEPQLGWLLRLLLRDYAPSLRKCTAVAVDWSHPKRSGRFEWVLHPRLAAPSRDIGDIG